jgi:hypothetical protein
VLLALLAIVAFVMLRPVADPKIDPQKIVMAAGNYTRALKQRNQPLPHSVSLQTLLEQHFLQPADVGAFLGLDANISLAATNGRPLVLMQVRLPDGSSLLLFPDGTTEPVKR